MSGPVLTVGGRPIGPGAPCFLIAEIGVNHNGRAELAERLIDAAAASGADAVKLQTWNTDALVTRDAPLAGYQQTAGAPSTQYQMLKQLELPSDVLPRLKARAERLGLLFFSTPHDEGSADLLARLDVPLFKIGSGDVTNLAFLRHVARKGRPIIMSTGMATLAEVASAVATIEHAGNRSLALLHCVSAYPSAIADSNLRAMDTLADAFGYPVGFSDHARGSEATLAAVARGAVAIEKHFTLDRTLPGPDHASSLEPDEFGALVRSIRAVESALGDGIKRPVSAELPIRDVARKVVVAAHAMHAGRVLTRDDLAVRRAGAGLQASALDSLVGRILRSDIQQFDALTWTHLEGNSEGRT